MKKTDLLRKGKKDLLSTGSLHEWLQWPEMTNLKPEARTFFLFSCVYAESQRLEPSSTVLWSYKQGAQLEMEQPRYKLASI